MNSGNIRTGALTGNGIAIGHGTSADAQIGLPTRPQEAFNRCDDLMQLLEMHATDVPDTDELRRPLALIQAELSSDRPHRLTLSSLLAAIGASVGGVAVIAEAVDRLQQAVTAMF